jgi:hypothetical protein
LWLYVQGLDLPCEQEWVAKKDATSLKELPDSLVNKALLPLHKHIAKILMVRKTLSEMRKTEDTDDPMSTKIKQTRLLMRQNIGAMSAIQAYANTTDKAKAVKDYEDGASKWVDYSANLNLIKYLKTWE